MALRAVVGLVAAYISRRTECNLLFLFTNFFIRHQLRSMQRLSTVFICTISWLCLVKVLSQCRTGKGSLSTSGGDGFAGGGGGRLSIDVYGRHDSLKIYCHGKTCPFIFEVVVYT